MHPSVLQALEDLLRRVFRGPHGIDVEPLGQQVRGRATRARAQREATAAVLLALAVGLLLLGWFVGDLMAS